LKIFKKNKKKKKNLFKFYPPPPPPPPPPPKAHKCQTNDHLNCQFDWPITQKTIDSAMGIIGIEPTLALAFYLFLGSLFSAL
jgi:hypothetical protein